MSTLDEAARSLARALDALEARIDERLSESAQQSETQDAAHRQARVARAHAGAASDGLAAAIGDLKTLLRASRPAEE